MSSPVFKSQMSQHFEMKRKSSLSKLSAESHFRALPVSAEADLKSEKMWKLMDKHLATDAETIQRAVVNHVEYTLSRNRFNMTEESCYRATAYSVRDRLIEMLNDTSSIFFERDVKRCYYLSLEFLTGRAMQNALTNLDIEQQYRTALAALGYNLETLYEFEHDAGLGNGGLGRLAACFLDSMATLNYACWGYGIRYTYGIFEQKIINGWQCEYPDYWLVQDNPWEIFRPDVTYAVRFGGEVVEYVDAEGVRRRRWKGGNIVQAVAYDNPIPGFDTFNCINLRLWRATPSKEFDFNSFNAGNYMDAVKERQEAECISAVLYPNDSTEQGKELRLKQQYFFCCATIQDVLRRFKKKPNRDWTELPLRVALQLNDTHPAIGIPELIRILVDVERLPWNTAVDLSYQSFHYTNHTVLPEALEKWSANLIGRLLPRHLEIINDINMSFINQVRAKWGDNYQKISQMSIYEDGNEKHIRMANLAVIGCNRVNGVAAIHSDLVRRDLYPTFVEWYKQNGESDKFINVTNGVTIRRWVHNSNRPLSNLISSTLGSDDWLKDFGMVAGLLNHIDNDDFVRQWAQVKLLNKKRLCKWVQHYCHVTLDPQMLFDIQTKRIHEYKRQHLFAFFMIHRYLAIKKMSPEQRKNLVPRASMIGGKAAPGYTRAKTIIKLITSIANVVNNDADVAPYFKICFLPNYNVSSAAIIIPASDVNEQISTAGTEASGTSNMKYVMNGSLIVGTMDGANVEIVEEGGLDTAFIFGAKETEVHNIRSKARDGRYPIDPVLQEVFGFIRSGALTSGDENAQCQFNGLVDMLCSNGYGQNGDYYLVCHDFTDFLRAQNLVDETYKSPADWWRMSIKAAASMGKFSTDRTIREYSQNVWNIVPCEIQGPSAAQLRRLASVAGAGSELNPQSRMSRNESMITPPNRMASSQSEGPLEEADGSEDEAENDGEREMKNEDGNENVVVNNKRTDEEENLMKKTVGSATASSLMEAGDDNVLTQANSVVETPNGNREDFLQGVD